MSSELIHSIAQMLNRVPGWCNIDKATDLVDLIGARQPKLIVESGIFGGRSLFAMAMTRKAWDGGVVWGVDPWTVEAAHEGEKDKANIDWWEKNVKLEEIYQQFVQNTIDFGLLPHVNWIRAKGEIAAGSFQPRSIELFHLDSNHSELISCREVETWAPKMADSSIWIMDDADWSTQAKAIEMIRARGFKTRLDRGKYLIFERQ
jgi:hypothetical protein